MRTQNTHISRNNHRTRVGRRLLGKRVKSERLSITETSTDFFEDIPLYRDTPHRKLGKKHLARSRKSKSTKT